MSTYIWTNQNQVTDWRLGVSRLKLKPYIDTFQFIASGCTCGCLRLPRLIDVSHLKRDRTLPEQASTSTPRHVERVDVFGTAQPIWGRLASRGKGSSQREIFVLALAQTFHCEPSGSEPWSPGNSGRHYPGVTRTHHGYHDSGFIFF